MLNSNLQVPLPESVARSGTYNQLQATSLKGAYTLAHRILSGLLPGPDGYAVLPPGRVTLTRDEFERAFAPEHSKARRSLIEDLDEYAFQQKRCGLIVLSYWIGGSFVSDKSAPNDIDVTSIISGEASLPSLNYTDWTNPRQRWQHEVHPDVGRKLRVDGYAMVKVPDDHPGLDHYYELRGYWDDWWQRCRATGAAESRGYVEVRDWNG